MECSSNANNPRLSNSPAGENYVSREALAAAFYPTLSAVNALPLSKLAPASNA
jgi:hypothetical protein